MSAMWSHSPRSSIDSRFQKSCGSWCPPASPPGRPSPNWANCSLKATSSSTEAIRAGQMTNVIEYAMMQAYAEGFELLEKVDLVDNVTEVFDSWREGTVVRSWLLDLLVKAMRDDPGLSQIAGYAEDSGEGRWTVEAAMDNAVPLHAISAALFARFASRQEESPAMKAIAAS